MKNPLLCWEFSLFQYWNIGICSINIKTEMTLECFHSVINVALTTHSSKTYCSMGCEVQHPPSFLRKMTYETLANDQFDTPQKVV